MIKNKLFAAIALAGFALLASQPSFAGTDKSAVMDKRGNPVTDKRDNCVRHDWNDGTDVCAPPPPPAPAPVAAPAPVPEPTPARQLLVDDRTVYFDFNKSELMSDSVAKLDNLAEVLKTSYDVKSAKIVGYADRVGSEEYNMKLSQKRAEAVQDYLTSKGYINTSIAQTSWLGEAAPKVECDGNKVTNGLINCLAENRRVEVQVEFIQ